MRELRWLAVVTTVGSDFFLSLTPVRQLVHHWLLGLTQRKSVRPTANLPSCLSARESQSPCSLKGTEADLLTLLAECCRNSCFTEPPWKEEPYASLFTSGTDHVEEARLLQAGSTNCTR